YASSAVPATRYSHAMSFYPRSSAFICGLIVFLVVAAAQTPTDAEVQKIHKPALLIDTHNDITSRTVDGYDIGKATNDGHTNLTALREGNVGGQFFAVYVSGTYTNGNHSAHRTLEMIDNVRHDIL